MVTLHWVLRKRARSPARTAPHGLPRAMHGLGWVGLPEQAGLPPHPASGSLRKLFKNLEVYYKFF